MTETEDCFTRTFRDVRRGKMLATACQHLPSVLLSMYSEEFLDEDFVDSEAKSEDSDVLGQEVT